MVAQSIAQTSKSNGLRPFDLRSDLLPLADLIETAFRDELDKTGNAIVREMRQVGRAGPLLGLVGAIGLDAPLMGGFVWVDNGRLVGNVTLAVESAARGIWSISNVAVHPGYRGHGIAQQMMQAALDELRNKGAAMIVLEVTQDNAVAQNMYHHLGFETYDSVDEMRLAEIRDGIVAAPPLPDLRKRRYGDWPGLYELNRLAIPTRAQEVRPLAPHEYRRGWEQALESWIGSLSSGRRSQEWVLQGQGELVAWEQATANAGPATHRLQLVVHPRHRGLYERQLLAVGLRWLQAFPARPVSSTLSTSHPEAEQAWHQAGFSTVRLLDRMVLDLRKEEQRKT